MVLPGDPRVKLIQMGLELRRLRDEAGFTHDEAAAVVGCQQSKLSKIENGKQAIRRDELQALLELYGAPRRQWDELLSLVQILPRGRAGRTHRDAVPDWFRRFVVLESAATGARVYESEIVTGLVQTEEYARSVILAWEPDADPDEVNRQVRIRMNRQTVVTRKRPAPMRLDVVLSEAALLRVQGSREIMAGQLDHLRRVSELPDVELRVLPFDRPNRIAVASSFTLLRLPEPNGTVVYLEDVVGATYPEDRKDINTYSVTFGRLRSAALDPVESRELIGKVADTYR
ncbi:MULTISPECIES: helix-turn-helix domain-containing protein [Actinoalloteichus]|uniref:DNA binding protein with helix-turn-helix domain n=1 Tax=Actinoalloteichus fjordicus TaxID=1612552 RepID=A0AAC9LGM2_9PSEU|nr:MULTISPECIES: helix-turn-helix transcriptional regulator [Actinoalloteichus]APU17006.1 DNA binding protein with helix-turn-helix domain [Actinoalloteichus fjordicus]APU23086.1 DNA binding protein with helix-turn-helix domain [Actinoalloteichus sp. GBA129-24]